MMVFEAMFIQRECRMRKVLRVILLLHLRNEALAKIFNDLNAKEYTSNFYSVGHARLDAHLIDSIEVGDDPFDIPLTQLDEDNAVHIHDNSLFGVNVKLKNPISQMIQDEYQHGQHNQLFGINTDNLQLTIPIEVQDQNENEINMLSTNFQKLKTGTTIVGVKTKTCIIIAADTRATEGSVVADKLCEKVHQLTKNIWCCGAGTSADLDALTRKIRYTFLLKSMIDDSIGNRSSCQRRVEFNEENTDWNNDFRTIYNVEGVEEDVGHPLGEATMAEICHMIRENLYKNSGDIGANLVLGGFDPYLKQPILTAVHPHGSIDVVPYTALGSGGLAAMGVLESRYHMNLSVAEGIELVKDAVRAGIENDLGSGSQIDLCVIDKNGVIYKKGTSIEEILPSLEGEDVLNNKLFLDHTLQTTVNTLNGVNGFGSLPYRIKKRTKIIDDPDQIQESDREWIKYIL